MKNEITKTRRMRLVKKVNKANQPKRKGRPKKAKDKTKRKKAAIITKSKFKKAIKGTGGRKTDIAQKLKCTVNTVWRRLNDPAWADVKQAYDEEVERIGDLAKQTIESSMRNVKRDPATAARTAQWYLSKMYKHEGFGDESKVTVQGGNVPLQVAHIPVESLDLSVEMKRKLLEALESKEESADNGQASISKDE